MPPDLASNNPLWGPGQLLFAAPPSLDVKFVDAGSELSALFLNTQLNVATPDSGPLSLTYVLCIQVPLNLAKDQQLIGYRQKLVLGILRTVGVRVSVVAELAGTLKCLEFEALDGNAGVPESVPHL